MAVGGDLGTLSGAVMPLPEEMTALAPDGSEVRVLLSTGHGGLAHFTFAAGGISPVITHRTVSELWFIVSGEGRVWLSDGPGEGHPLRPGTCLRIPVGVSFQVKAGERAPLRAVGATMPPWPGSGEATVTPDGGPWRPTLEPGPH